MAVLSGTAVTIARRPMPAVDVVEYDSPAVRLALRRERDERRTRIRSHWWFPLFVLLIALSGVWGLIKADQVIAQDLIWPGAGAQFVEVGPIPEDPDAIGGRMMIVAAGLNRKSGTGVAAVLMPSLTVGGTRVFSLVYGSGINDQDILDKYNGLLNRYQPRQVSFFGSSMGGDVVLALAAHTQTLRDAYRSDLQSAAVDTVVSQGTSGQELTAGAGSAESADPAASTHPPRTPTDAAAAPTADPTAADPTVGIRRPVGAQTAEITGILLLPDAAVSRQVGATGLSAMSLDFRTAAVPRRGIVQPEILPPPRLGTIFLDCSPLGADDVRDSSRTQADLLTGIIEGLDTEGGAGVRLAAEVLAQREQWSSGAFPFLQVRYEDLKYKFSQVLREKISSPGISTQLIKDQYGVIRRTDIDDITDALGPGTRIVYFLPEQRSDDRTVRVEQVESTLLRLASEKQLNVSVVSIPGGHHASAETDSSTYRTAMDHLNGIVT